MQIKFMLPTFHKYKLLAISYDVNKYSNYTIYI